MSNFTRFPPSKFQLHKSGLELLQRCGIAFERRYVLGERTAPSVSMSIGTAVDRSVTADLAQKIQTGRLLHADSVTDCARDALVNEWDRGVMLDDDFQAMGYAAAQGEAIDSAVALARLHHIEVAPAYNPVRVQREWVLDIAGLDMQLAGTIDVVNQAHGKLEVWDTKTSRKSPVADQAHKSLQLTTYAMAMEAHGEPVAAVGLAYLVKTKTPKVVLQMSTRSGPDYEHLLARVSRAKQVIDSGMFTPASIDDWYCSSKYCPFHSTCPYARKPVSVAVK